VNLRGHPTPSELLGYFAESIEGFIPYFEGVVGKAAEELCDNRGRAAFLRRVNL
jgi:hypothetical protein